MLQSWKNKIYDYLMNPKYRIHQHVLFIVCIVVLMTNNVYFNYKYLGSETSFMSAWVVYITTTVTAFYLNSFVLVPFFLFKNRVTSYFLALILLVFISLFCLVMDQVYLLRWSGLIERIGYFSVMINIISSLITLTFMLAGGTTLLLIKRWINHNKLINELESANLRSELKLLKNQINPHFLFNMLNNANVLIWKNKQEAARIIFKLEDLLRYQLNVTHKDEVLLSFDIRFLSDFLNLEKIRRDKFEFSITKEGDLEDVWIPSLMFIPFVENAVKHNPDSHHLSYVHLIFRLKGNILYFECNNSKPVGYSNKNKVGGIGLKNIRRRLTLLYPERHTLEIIDSETVYITKLKLAL